MAAPILEYEIRYRRSGISAPWTVRRFPADSNIITLTGLQRGVAYEGEARSIGPGGTASAWVAVTFTTPNAIIAPRAPTNLAAQSVADGVALSWQVDAEQAADVEYIVERAAAETGPFTTLTRVRALQYTDPVTDQVIRWYRVRAVNFQGVMSAPSQAVNSNGKASSVIISETAPANPAVGTQWHQPSTNLTRVWNGSGWSLMADNSLVTQQTATLVKDGGFEAGGQGWMLAPNARIDRGTGVPYIGSAALIHDPVAGGPVQQTYCERFAVAPGERIIAEAMIRNWQGAANGYAALVIWFYDQSLNFIGEGGSQTYSDGRDSGNYWRKCNAIAVVPANAARCAIGLQTTNSSGFWVADQFRALKQPSSNVNSQVLLPQSITTAYGSVRNTTALTASSSGAVSVNAHVVRYGGFSVAYNAVANAVTGLAQNTRYVIYCFDPDYTGGTKTWFAGTNPDAVMQLGDGVVIAGEITIPTSGTGSGGGGSGGGGGEWCVDATMRLPDGRIAGDVAAGDIIACWDENAATPGVQERDVESNALVESQPCTRIMTLSGAAVVASDCTPMTLRDGRIVRITQMLGEDALVRHADGTLAWEPVVSCTSVGSRTVAKIKVHQLCYFAGESAAATIATHNPIAKP